MFTLFANNTQVYLLYLFYGASFLFLGVSIVTKDMKGSDLKLADCLWLLAAFAFLHGFCEWLELGHLLDGQNVSPHQASAVKKLMVCISILSFMFLIQFGASLVSKLESNRTTIFRAVPAFLFTIWLLYLGYSGSQKEVFELDMSFLRQAKTAAKILFGFPGSMLTAYGMIVYAREIKGFGATVTKKLTCAGIAFVFYGTFTGVLSAGYPLPMLPVPAELLRGVSAFFITCFLANALTIFDIEKRKKFEHQTRRLAQSEKLASLGQLAAGIAHEINNPLATASLSIQTLKRRMNTCDDNGRKAVEKLDAVERNIDRASVIAQELLHFSRQRDTEFTPLDLNTVIRGATTLMRHRLIGYTLLEELSDVPQVMGDAGRLEQVFINILSNALEAMPEAGTVSISTTVHDDAVLARVSDTGIGIDTENLAQVFDPFFTTKEIGNGTGLGLYISYGIIAQHKGQIDIDSRAGQGTTLTVRLPTGEEL